MSNRLKLRILGVISRALGVPIQVHQSFFTKGIRL